MTARGASAASPAPDDRTLAARVASGHHASFEMLMRRYNARLFRVARAILRDDAEAEDALQDAYLDAYRRMDSFHGESALATWLTRLVINRALMRLRRHRRDRIVVPFAAAVDRDGRSMETEMADPQAEPPGAAIWRTEVRQLIERRVDELPVAFRTVFVLRDVEDLSVEETAACLSIPAATVRTRLFRARALLREALARDLDRATGDVFGFAGARCDRIVANVLERLDEARREHLD
jgi:RNA polymerase sigma-70 factor (ECF subfamily)